MGNFYVRVKDLLHGGGSVTVFCHCLERTLWTPDCIERFPASNRLWDTATHFRCWKCGRLGMVRDMAVHATPVATVDEPATRVRARVAVLRKKPHFGTRQQRPPKKGPLRTRS